MRKEEPAYDKSWVLPFVWNVLKDHDVPMSETAPGCADDAWSLFPAMDFWAHE